jgi:renalase
MNKLPHIAVIGAGIAGLSCATQLQEAGLKVSVFDKSRGPGGRMSTRRGDDWQCDHGAQYFTARDADFQAEVARWQAAGVAALWQPRLAVLG